MGSREFYDYLRVLYNFDIEGYYEDDFENPDFDFVKSFKEFQDVAKIVGFNIDKYTINSLFAIQIEYLDPILWKSVLNMLKCDCKDKDFNYYKWSLIKIFKIFIKMEHDSYDNFEHFLNLVYKVIKCYMISEFKIEKVIKDKGDIECLIAKENRVYCLDFTNLYRIENEKLVLILSFKDRKDWSKIYKYMDIQNCYCMCDNVTKERE